MNQATLALFVLTMERINALERQERENHYHYLLEQGDKTDTLDAHMTKFARFASFGTPASAASIVDLQRLSGPPLPRSLIDFYLTTGAFDGGERLSDLKVLSVPEPLAKSQTGECSWNKSPSMGLVDMILLSWGADLYQFNPASGEGLTQAEVLALNLNYSVNGWHYSDFGEAFDYLYFDAQGRFGIVGFHQDDFDSFYSEHLAPKIVQSAARLTLDEALAAMLKSAEAAVHAYDDESDSQLGQLVYQSEFAHAMSS
jgi:hypothetical protein